MDVEKIIKKYPILLTIPPHRKEEIKKYFGTAPEWLMDFLSVEILPPKTVFIRSFDKADMIYYVVDGIYKAIDYRMNGVEYVFAKFSKTYSMGAMEVLMGYSEYLATLQTINRCIAIKLNRQEFVKWLESDNLAIWNEAKMMGEYLLRQGLLAREYLFLPAPERMAKIFIQKYEQDSKDGKLLIKLSRQELSNEVGFSTKTISRVINLFLEENLIKKHKRNILINSEQYLKLKEKVEKIVSTM